MAKKKIRINKQNIFFDDSIPNPNKRKNAFVKIEKSRKTKSKKQRK